MKQYIKKSAVVEKIKKRLLPVIRDKHYDEWEEGQDSERIAILDIIDTLETKEVDLEKEINKYISDNFFGSETMGFFAARTKEEPNDIDIALCAKYFFELGLKAKKGE